MQVNVIECRQCSSIHTVAITFDDIGVVVAVDVHNSLWGSQQD